jgi:hypothetical protein
MTLSIGDKLVKLNPQTGEPLTLDLETYIEYEVMDLSPSGFGYDGSLKFWAILRKVK